MKDQCYQDKKKNRPKNLFSPEDDTQQTGDHLLLQSQSSAHTYIYTCSDKAAFCEMFQKKQGVKDIESCFLWESVFFFQGWAHEGVKKKEIKIVYWKLCSRKTCSTGISVIKNCFLKKCTSVYIKSCLLKKWMMVHKGCPWTRHWAVWVPR